MPDSAISLPSFFRPSPCNSEMFGTREHGSTQSAAAATETSPLLPNADGKVPAEKKHGQRSVVLRVLITAFLVSVSFSITQVP